MYHVQVNKDTFQNHIQYDWWKYLVGIIATLFIWSMVTTMTRPRTPADKKIEVFLVGDYMIEEASQPISTAILEDFPELLEATFNNIPLGGDAQMDYMGRQKLMVMLGSQTGDIFIFTKEEFEVIAEQGAFIPLDEHIQDFKKFVPKEKLEEYKFKALDEEESHYYGVPIEQVSLFKDSGYNVSDKVMGVMAYSKNQDKAMEVFKWLLNNGNK